jgi:hypothetical protein
MSNIFSKSRRDTAWTGSRGPTISTGELRTFATRVKIEHPSLKQTMVVGTCSDPLAGQIEENRRWICIANIEPVCLAAILSCGSGYKFYALRSGDLPHILD